MHRVMPKLGFKTVPGTELEFSGFDSYDLYFVFLWFLFGVWVPNYLLPPSYARYEGISVRENSLHYWVYRDRRDGTN